MKKKKLLLLSLIPLILIAIILITLFKKEKQFYLNDEYYGNNSIIEIDNTKLQTLESNKKSFAVLIHDSLCAASYDFSDHIKDFSINNNITIYKLSFAYIKDTSVAKYVKYCPSLVIYKNGEIKAYLDSSSNKDSKYFGSEAGFQKWFIKYVKLK